MQSKLYEIGQYLLDNRYNETNPVLYEFLTTRLAALDDVDGKGRATASEILRKRIIRFPSDGVMDEMGIVRNVIASMEEYAAQFRTTPLPVADVEGEKVGPAPEKLETPNDLIKSLNWCKNLLSSITAASIAGKNLDFVKQGTPFFEEMLNAYQSAKFVLMNYENETHYATQFGEYQLCPKCGGFKQIMNPNLSTVTGTLTIPCDICNGAGIIPKPLLPSAVTGGVKWVKVSDKMPDDNFYSLVRYNKNESGVWEKELGNKLLVKELIENGWTDVEYLSEGQPAQE